MGRHSSIWLVIGALAVGCGDASPTKPTANPGPGTSDGPAARVTVTIDSLGSEEAIAALSEVTLDATGSTGAGPLTYRLDFGDGASATTATARHIYATSGNYTAAVTVTDAAGRAMTVSKPVGVRVVSGTWLHAGYSAGAREVIVRRLSVTSQSGTTVRGFVELPSQPDRSVTGELVSPRTLSLTFDDPAFGSLEGVLPSVLTPPASLELRALGGPANGERLAFRPADGEPTGPPPDAVLNHRYFSFSAPFAIRGFSPMRFDGSGSRGEGLSYFMEFGDGHLSTEPISVHPIDEAGEYTTRLTVVDRFGRVDSEVLRILVRTLQAIPLCCFWISKEGPMANAIIQFSSQRGNALSGGFFRPLDELNGRFSGVLSGEREIRLVLDASGIVLTGTLDLPGEYEFGWLMRLKQAGGVNSGRELIFHLDSPG